MKNIYILFLVLFISTNSFSQVLLNEDFDYGSSSGDLTTTSSGNWSAYFAGTPTVGYVDTSLSKADYPASDIGGSASFTNDNAGENISRSFSTINSGDVYYSALVNLTTVGAGDSGFFLHLNTTGSEIRGRVFAKSDGIGGVNFGVISQGTNVDIAWGTNSYSLNTTYLLVVHYDFSNGVSTLYVLSTPTTFESDATPEAISMAATIVTAVSSVAIRQHNAGPAGTIDGIRVATSWEYLMVTLTLFDGPPNGASITAAPETETNASISFTTTNLVMSNDAGGGTGSGGQGFIKWNIQDTSDNNVVDSGNIFTSNDGFDYPVNNLLAGKTYLLTAQLVDNSGVPFSDPIVTYTLTVTIATFIDLPNLAALRAYSYTEDDYFRVTGPVTNTFSRPTFNNQQYFQDDMAAILVVDPNFEIATYNEGDVINNLKGQLFEGSDGVLRLIPSESDWGAAIGNNPIIPEVVTTQQIKDNLENYESELVEIKNATFKFPGGNFTAGAVHLINDGSGSDFAFRCNFPEVDYVTSPTVIPATPQNIVGLVLEFQTSPRITAREIADLTLDAKEFKINHFNLYPNPTSLDYVNISSKSNSEISVSIYNIIGNMIKEETVINNEINLDNLSTGIYILKIKQDNTSVTKKLIVK